MYTYIYILIIDIIVLTLVFPQCGLKRIDGLIGILRPQLATVCPCMQGSTAVEQSPPIWWVCHQANIDRKSFHHTNIWYLQLMC